METEYKVIGTSPRDWVNPLGDLISGVEIVFTFGDNHQGRIRVSNDDMAAGLGKEKIKAYIEQVSSLE